MSRTAHKLISASGGKAYEIEQSVMFNRGDDPYLSRTPSSAGNLRTWTLSWWMKRNDCRSNSITASQIIFGVGDLGASATPHSHNIYFRGDQADRFTFEQWSGSGTTSYGGTTRREFADVAAWTHFVFIQDSTDGTAGDRFKIYVNGVRETDIPWGTALTSNWDGLINTTTAHYIGGSDPSGDNRHSMMQLAEMHFIDGTAKAVGDFGETDEDTGQWIPKEYTGGSYGTNGFYLKFESGAIGTDSSGQGNNWTTSNLADSDILLDTPTNNFPTFNSLDSGSNIAVSQGNLKVTGSGWGDTHVTTKIPHTGKWYWELAATTNGNLYYGLWTTNYTDTDASQGYGTGKQVLGTGGITGGSSGAYFGSAVSNGDIIGMAVDCDNGKIWWSKNGTWGSSGNPATGANEALTFTATDDYKIQVTGASGNVSDINFGQNGTFTSTKTAQGNSDSAGIGDFYYSPPSGFKALCSKNLPTPTIKKSTEHFNTLLYTGNDADDRTLTGVGFQPDLVWIKTRNATNYHILFDSVRGVSKDLHTNLNYVESTASDPNNSLVAFTSDGFTVDHTAANEDLNASAHTYVAWNWKAGGSGSANNDGSINTTATSVNTTAGFSISNYQGTGSNATVGHGLGVAPSVIIIKNRDTDDNWRVYSRNDATDYLSLNWNGASTDDNTTWNDTAPTSSVFTIGTDTNVNRSGDDFIAYCFANVEGFFKSGTYRGNGESENGPYVYTGFSPALVIVKEASSAGGSWFMWDNKREVYNVRNTAMWADTSNQDTAHAEYEIDFLSNGFKIRGNSAATNQDGETMLYLCWAEAPFKYSLAR